MRMSQSWVINPEERAAKPEQQVPHFTVYLEHLGHLLKKNLLQLAWGKAQESVFKSFQSDSDVGPHGKH